MENTRINNNIITNFGEDLGAGLLRTVLLANTAVPYSHKRAAK